MKKKSKRLIALLLSLLMVISLLPTTGLTIEAAKKPELEKKSSSIVIAGISKIKVKNAPKGAKITYKSAKKDIATISKQGNVKGIKSGTTNITVYVKKNSKTTKLTYKVTVKKPKLSKSNLSLVSGKTAKLSIKNKPKKAKYTWQSSNPKVATVNKNGTVVAKKKGTANIEVKVKTAKETSNLSCKVTVKQTYTITFDSNGGSLIASQTVEKNALATRPADPTRSGYTFIGWYTEANGGQKFDFNTAITGNITLYANWINSQLTVNNLGISHIVQSLGHYINWAGISTVSQFADEQGRFCFTFCDETTVTIIKVDDTRITKTIQVPRLHPLLGAATCDDKGNLYLVWGHKNEGTDTTVSTIFVSKYSSNGELIATVGGNGSEGLASYYDDSFYTKIPFKSGNCDVAVNGNLLLVNYASIIQFN